MGWLGWRGVGSSQQGGLGRGWLMGYSWDVVLLYGWHWWPATSMLLPTTSHMALMYTQLQQANFYSWHYYREYTMNFGTVVFTCDCRGDGGWGIGQQRASAEDGDASSCRGTAGSACFCAGSAGEAGRGKSAAAYLDWGSVGGGRCPLAAEPWCLECWHLCLASPAERQGKYIYLHCLTVQCYTLTKGEDVTLMWEMMSGGDVMSSCCCCGGWPASPSLLPLSSLIIRRLSPSETGLSNMGTKLLLFFWPAAAATHISKH